MLTHTPVMSVEAFEQFAALPDNADKRLEWIGGEIVEVVSNNTPSEIAARIMVLLGLFVLSNKLGRLMGADGGYMVQGERYIPDVSFISFKKQPQRSTHTWNLNAPDLAVEVVSPSDNIPLLMIKVANYLAAGTLVWVVYPDERTVHVFAPGDNPRILHESDTLDGGQVLPGLKLAVEDVFAE